LAATLQRGQLQHVVAAHLSRTSNRPELALQALQEALLGSTQLSVADAAGASAWISPAGG
jgi:hypothetical protein